MAGNILKDKYVKPSGGVNFSRSLFRYEKRHSTNIMAGNIVPVNFQFLYPGTSPDFNFGCVVESAPLISTCLDNIYIDIVTIWTPIRLVMKDWNEFLGESHTTAFTINRNISIPKLYNITVETDGSGHSISRAYYADHYLGGHIGYREHKDTNYSTSTYVDADSIFKRGISVLPSRIYELNWNTFFRNENLQPPILIDTTSSVGTHDSTYYAVGLGRLQRANVLKTWYFAATPAPSLLDVSIALDKYLAPVSMLNETGSAYTIPSTFNINPRPNTSIPTGLTPVSRSGPNTTDPVFPLVTDLSSLTVNRMYYALMEQRFANKMMKGRRAVEFYENFFGVKGSEAGHDLPQLISHKRYPINISQVIATASGTNGTETSDLGQRGAFSTTGFGGPLVHNFTATEHGYLMTYAIIRGQPSVYKGIDHFLGINTLLDTYIPEFDHIGPVGIERLEMDDAISATNLYWAYTNAWYAERNQTSDVVGIMEPGQPLSYKTLAHDLGPVIRSVLGVYDTFTVGPRQLDRLFMFPVCYETPHSTSPEADWEGCVYQQNRYQFLLQFAVKGKFAAVMSPDSEPLKLRL